MYCSDTQEIWVQLRRCWKCCQCLSCPLQCSSLSSFAARVATATSVDVRESCSSLSLLSTLLSCTCILTRRGDRTFSQLLETSNCLKAPSTLWWRSKATYISTTIMADGTLQWVSHALCTSLAPNSKEQYMLVLLKETKGLSIQPDQRIYDSIIQAHSVWRNTLYCNPLHSTIL